MARVQPAVDERRDLLARMRRDWEVRAANDPLFHINASRREWAIPDFYADGTRLVGAVVDPVLASGRGDEMANDDMIGAINELLLPLCTLITPNSLEARRLAADEDEDPSSLDLGLCAERLLSLGTEFVLVTGTHENTGRVINKLYGSEGLIRQDDWERLPHSYHGSGCTLASAIAATLANGLPLEDAVREAQEYTWQTLAAGFRPGMGQHIPDRLFWARSIDDASDTNNTPNDTGDVDTPQGDRP